jgi:hypothetical protein
MRGFTTQLYQVEAAVAAAEAAATVVAVHVVGDVDASRRVAAAYL